MNVVESKKRGHLASNTFAHTWPTFIAEMAANSQTPQAGISVYCMMLRWLFMTRHGADDARTR